MNLNDPWTIAAAALLVVAILYFVAQGRPARAVGRGPGRKLIDHYEETGRDAAGRILEQRLGEVRARRIGQEMGEAFGPAPAAASPTSAPTAAGATPGAGA